MNCCRTGSSGAHPRSRGEHFTISTWAIAVLGSSPLTRGALLVGARIPTVRGLIPAHAGSTCTTVAGAGWWRAHPRSRGEHSRRRSAVDAAHGLIPAHAGSTTACVNVSTRNGAHPRSRGEHQAVVCAGVSSRGSSPLTRGALVRPRHRPTRHRLIPAHAGSTCRRTPSVVARRAHPRSRGEHTRAASSLSAAMGSSPLTRGAREGHWCGRVDRGLIPAHAGSTEALDLEPAVITAHPRSRGEHPGRGRSRSANAGSSPLTRGARDQRCRPEASAGLIPAHAGSTQTPERERPPPWAHPRSRGEHRIMVTGSWGRWGSSPLTRGAPDGEDVWVAAGGAHPRSRGEHL